MEPIVVLSLLLNVVVLVWAAHLWRRCRHLQASRDLLRDLLERLDRAREEERGELARWVHDELGQSMTALRLELGLLEGHSVDAAGQRGLRAVASLADGTLRNVRQLQSRLRPALLDDLGLEAAVEWHVEEFRREHGLECTLETSMNGLEADRDRDTVVYRALQEALLNVARHAGAGRVDTRLMVQEPNLILEVVDDGRGIGHALERGQAPGLLTMRERVERLGGHLAVTTATGGGTRLALALPLGRGTP